MVWKPMNCFSLQPTKTKTNKRIYSLEEAREIRLPAFYLMHTERRRQQQQQQQMAAVVQRILRSCVCVCLAVAVYLCYNFEYILYAGCLLLLLLLLPSLLFPQVLFATIFVCVFHPLSMLFIMLTHRARIGPSNGTTGRNTVLRVSCVCA